MIDYRNWLLISYHGSCGFSPLTYVIPSPPPTPSPQYVWGQVSFNVTFLHFFFISSGFFFNLFFY